MNSYQNYQLPIFGTSLLDTLSLTSICSTIGLFLCGIPICQRIALKGTTDGTPAAPFLMGTLGCFLWFKYGRLREDYTIQTVNSIGLILYGAYLAFYYIHTKKRTWLNRCLASLGLFIIGVFYYVNTTLERQKVVDNLGLICVVSNVLNFAAPLAGLRDVFRMKTTASIPFALCVAGLVVSSQWFFYGCLINDRYIMIPNFIGIVLSVIQLALFVIYPSSRIHAIDI